jgi:hypothetical protein
MRDLAWAFNERVARFSCHSVKDGDHHWSFKILKTLDPGLRRDDV